MKQPITDLTGQQKWSGEVEEGRGAEKQDSRKLSGDAASLSSGPFVLPWTTDFTTDRPQFWLKNEFPFYRGRNP